MRYRIIKEVNLNDEVFYEVHFRERVRFMLFFKRWKWVPSYEHKRMGGDFWVTRTARYESMEEAQKIVNKHATKRLMMEEGEVNEDDSYSI